MNEFSAAIAAFLAGHAGYAQLEATLARALQQDPSIAPIAFTEVDRVYKTGLLPLQIYVALKNLIAQSSASSSQRPPLNPARHPAPGRAMQPQAPTEPVPTREAPPRRQRPLGSGSVLKRRFVLESEVGRGGMGVVFRAKDLRKEEAQVRDPYVAIKILNDEFRRHPESFKALQREARKSQQLAHPNIVRVFDFDRDGATVYMTMEFLEGQPLDAIIKRPGFGGMELADAYPLVRGIGSALAHAHDKGIVHSDFKPGNCFVTEGGVVKVFDFGIARASKAKSDLDRSVTKFDAGALGALTPAYASSEMTAGESPDPRDDIYAFGCVIYEMLAGEHPFACQSAAEARRAGLVARPIGQLSRRQWRVLRQALAFRRADRTATIAEVVDGLGEAPRSRAPARIAVAAAALIVAGVAAYFGVGIWQQQRYSDLAAALSSGNDARVVPALESLGRLDGTRRMSVLNDVAEPLLRWYERRVDAVADKDRGPYDFRRAAAIANEARSWYPDSARLEDLRRRKEEEAATLVKDLEARLAAAFAAGRLAPDPSQDDVGDVIEILRQADPTNALLDRGRLVAEYTQRATAALRASDSARAKSFVDAGLARFPDEPSLRNLAANFSAPSDPRPATPTVAADPVPAVAEPSVDAAAAAAINRRAQVDGIKRTFEGFLQAGDALGARAARDRLRALLPANDPYLAGTASGMAELYLNVANARFDARDFGSARRAAEDGLREWPSSTALAALSGLSADVDTLHTRIAAGAAGDANADKDLRARIRSDAGTRFAKIDGDLIATAEQRVAENPGNAAYVAYVTAVFERAFGGGASPAATQPAQSVLPASAPPVQSALSAAAPPVPPPPLSNEAPPPLFRIDPDYPPRALSRGVEGWVRLRFTITATGTVANATVVDSEPADTFDEAALRAIARWRYSPPVGNGLADARVGVETVIRFTAEQ